MIPVVKVMSRLGLVYVTAIMTVLSAFLSMAVAWVFGLFIRVPNYQVHIFLAFVIPFFVTPTFSYLSALSMRELQRARKRAYDLARLDALTGIPNRRAFFDTARERAEAARARSAGQAVLFIDIDNFKAINDRHGHECGDAVLKGFAELLSSCTRRDDLVARIGGEEFVVHVTGVELAGLATIAAGIVARVRLAGRAGETQVPYTVSIGGALGDGSVPIDRLLSAADAELYMVKNGGRNNYRVVDSRTPVEAGAAPERRVRAG